MDTLNSNGNTTSQASREPPRLFEVFAEAAHEGAVWFDASEETMRAEVADPEVWCRLIAAVGEHPEAINEIVLLDDRGQEIRLCCVCEE